MAIKILLVDDTKELGDSVREILKSLGYHLEEATNIENALSKLADETFDLILLDITLPQKSGFQVLEFLKKNSLSSKVIVITGSASLEHTIKASTVNEWDYITKPYDPSYLIKFIEHILSNQSQPNHKLHIIKAGDFIKSTPTGDLDMLASKQGFIQIAAAGAQLEEYNVLIDLREVKSRLTTTNIYQLASELVHYGATFRRKTAILTRAHDDLSQANFFEDAAQNRGFDVKAFTTFEDALSWLSNTTRMTDFPIT